MTNPRPLPSMIDNDEVHLHEALLFRGGCSTFFVQCDDNLIDTMPSCLHPNCHSVNKVSITSLSLSFARVHRHGEISSTIANVSPLASQYQFISFLSYSDASFGKNIIFGLTKKSCLFSFWTLITKIYFWLDCLLGLQIPYKQHLQVLIYARNCGDSVKTLGFDSLLILILKWAQ